MAKDDLSSIRSKYGSVIGSKLIEPDNKLWLPSRILTLNYQLGGGIPYGKIGRAHV